MTIPFLDLFKKITGRSAAATAEPPAPATPTRVAKKPASERLSKTVLPHATRSFSPPDPFRSAAGAISARTGTPPLELGARRITAAPKKSQSSSLPPALARALEPKLERTISLRIADFIDRVPAGYIKPVEILDASVRVSLKASEIEKGMPEQNPTIALPSLYQQVPEIFLRNVRPDDDTRVALPYEKVLEQFKSANVRSDQLRDPAVPQLDTPILKATIQDSKRFGTKIEPIETSPLPSIPMKTATAESIAAAEPDAIVHETVKSKSSDHPVVSLYSPALKPKSEPPAPKSPSQTGSPSRTGSIPFDLSPNGTGASASERVPASSGPPVPTPLPFLPDLPKIAFQPPVGPPKPPLTLTKAPVASSAPKPAITSTPAKDETPITLSLKVVFKNLPAFQLDGDITKVSEETRVALPLSLVEPQLASGRISIAPEVFQAAVPKEYRNFFQLDDVRTPVALPLEEVLKNLPATILKLRDDQENVAPDTDFETPFSIKAKEDAQRLAAGKAPTEKVSDKPTAQVVEAKIDIAPSAEKKIDPKEIIAEASALAGVKSCAITFSDGLSLAGELPEEIAAEGLCAMAPALVERIVQHVRETKLGSLKAVTLYTSSSAISFFAQGNICLTALHAEGSLPPQTRTQIAELVEKLSRTYAQTEKPHVDH
jgi:predicted regulator of Ras-like GTPase activity (Roadblock/LC7/MglB family)